MRRRSVVQAARRRFGAIRGSRPTGNGSTPRNEVIVVPGISLLFHDVYRRTPSESGFQGPGADRYKLSLEEFDAVLSALQTTSSSAIGSTAPSGVPPAAGVLITVDDGGSSYYDIVADRLEALGWRGCCFISTRMIGRRGFLDASRIRELDRRGHVIGSHSVSHPPRFSACSWPQMVDEWTSSRKALEDLLGHPVEVASLPGGALSPAASGSADAARLRTLFTSEPERRVRQVGECRLIGRYTVRRGYRPAFVQALVSPMPAARWREWVAWNGKKIAKSFLGSAYPRLGAWMASHQ